MTPFTVTVGGNTLDDLIENLEAILDGLGGDTDVEDDDDEPTQAPAKKKPVAKKPAPVEDDDDEDEEDDEDDDDDDEVEDYTEDDLKSKSLGDLKEIAEDEFEIDINGLKKAQLIEAILEAQEEEEDDDDQSDEDDDDEDEGYTEDELNDMELDELKKIAKEEGITVTPRMRKATLVKAIFDVAGVEDED